MEWRDGEQRQEERTRSAINKPRDQFISRLLARVKQQQQPQSQPGPAHPSPSLDGTDDSWEALADTEEEQKEDEKEEEKKSRSLFLALRGSELALRLEFHTFNT